MPGLPRRLTPEQRDRAHTDMKIIGGKIKSTARGLGRAAVATGKLIGEVAKRAISPGYVDRKLFPKKKMPTSDGYMINKK